MLDRNDVRNQIDYHYEECKREKTEFWKNKRD